MFINGTTLIFKLTDVKFVMNPQETPGVLTSVSMATDAEKGRAIFNSEEYRATLKDVADWMVARPERSEYACHSLEIKEIPESLLVP